jgi:hypothetical protein
LLFASALWAQGGEDILPGASLKGWTRVAIPPENALDPVSQWRVDKAAGILVCEGNHGHEWLRLDRELADFLLHVEWRFTKLDNETRYNSGVFVRNSLDGKIWHQAQAGLAGGWLFGVTPVNGAPQRINLRPEMKENRVKPAGEWNVYDIRCQGKTISLTVNGAVTSEFTACEVPKGYIGLEAEGYRIEFRNLKLTVSP